MTKIFLFYANIDKIFVKTTKLGFIKNFSIKKSLSLFRKSDLFVIFYSLSEVLLSASTSTTSALSSFLSTFTVSTRATPCFVKVSFLLEIALQKAGRTNMCVARTTAMPAKQLRSEYKMFCVPKMHQTTAKIKAPR